MIKASASKIISNFKKAPLSYGHFPKGENQKENNISIMENAITLNIEFGSLISMLLAIVAYFIKQLHSDFKKMEKDLTEVKTMALLIKTEFKNSYDLLNHKVDYLEHRVNNLEKIILKNFNNEK